MMFTFSTLSVTCHSFCPSVHEVGEFPDVCYTSRITDLSFSKFLQETPKTCLYPTGDCLLVFTLFFVCWQNYAKNYSADFHKIRRKDSTWATEEPIKCWW